MGRRGLVAIGLLLICIIAMLLFKRLFKRGVKEGFLGGSWKSECYNYGVETPTSVSFAVCPTGSGSAIWSTLSDCSAGTAVNCWGNLTCGTQCKCPASTYANNNTCTA